MKHRAVYYIENLANNKYYIGSSIDVYGRWSIHLSALRNNKHPNRYLQFAWNRHGEEKFVFGLMECVSEKIDIIEREQYWIDKTHASLPEFGYNLRKFARSNKDISVSKETRLKLSIAAKRRGAIPPSPKGRVVSEATKLKSSLAKKGKINSPSHRENTRLARIAYLERTREPLILTEPPIEWRK